jgi:hypothetical protein
MRLRRTCAVTTILFADRSKVLGIAKQRLLAMVALLERAKIVPPPERISTEGGHGNSHAVRNERRQTLAGLQLSLFCRFADSPIQVGLLYCSETEGGVQLP